MSENPDSIDDFLSDKVKFDRLVYTDWREAVKELEARQSNAELDSYVNSLNPNGIPEVMRGQCSLVYFRHVISPNFETHRFMMCADVLHQYQPLLFELKKDKFTDINPLKRGLGKLPFYRGKDCNGKPIIEYTSLIDMCKWNGKSIEDVCTYNGTRMSDFHR